MHHYIAIIVSHIKGTYSLLDPDSPRPASIHPVYLKLTKKFRSNMNEPGPIHHEEYVDIAMGTRGTSEMPL